MIKNSTHVPVSFAGSEIIPQAITGHAVQFYKGR